MKNIDELNQLIFLIDNTPDIEKHGVHIDGIFISFWMLIRFTLSDLLLTHLGYGVTADSIEAISLRKIKWLNAYQHRVRKDKADILFISQSVGNIHYDKKYVDNIYHDAFAKTLIAQGKSVVIIEQTEPGKIFKQRKITPHAYSLMWSYLICKAKTVLTTLIQHHDADLIAINTFTNQLQALLAPHLFYHAAIMQKIKTALSQTVRSLNNRIIMWEKIIRQTQPKIVIMQDICFGGVVGLASLVFKKHNVRVIEDQHGVINESHIAYRYGELIIDKPVFTEFFPDYFFAYGKQWLEFMNVKTQKIIIGNPHLTQAQRDFKNIISTYDLLVLTDSERPLLMREKLLPLFKQPYRILFRPHPREWSVLAERYQDLLCNKNITVDQDRNIYRSLSKVKAVICFPGNFLSTVGYEALAFGKPVLCYTENVSMVKITDKNNLSSCIHFYSQMQDLSCDILHLLQKETQAHFNTDDFYDPNWKTNITAAINHCLTQGHVR